MSGRNFNITDRIAVTGGTNTGTGLTVFDSKIQSTLQFRSITTGPNLTATLDSGAIRLNNFPIVPNLASLPSSPSVNDLIFFEPLRSTMMWTGSDWQGDVKYLPVFWKPGNTNASAYMNIGNSMVGFSATTPFGFFIPNFQANVLSITLLGFAVSNTGLFDGQFEMHNNSTVDPPVFSTTGVGSPLVLLNVNQGSIVFSPAPLIPVGTFLQCFWRRTSGTASNIQIGILFANRIIP